MSSVQCISGCNLHRSLSPRVSGYPLHTLQSLELAPGHQTHNTTQCRATKELCNAVTRHSPLQGPRCLLSSPVPMMVMLFFTLPMSNAVLGTATICTQLPVLSGCILYPLPPFLDSTILDFTRLSRICKASKSYYYHYHQKIVQKLKSFIKKLEKDFSQQDTQTS